MKGRFCSKFRKNTTPYHLICENGFEELNKEKSPIPPIIELETNLMYILMSSVEFLIYDIDRRLREREKCFSENKQKQFAKIKLAIDKTKEEFDKLQKDYTYAFNGEKYDMFIGDTFESIRLMLLYADRCGTNVDNMNEIFSILRKMKGEGIVTEQDLKRFYPHRK